LLTVGAPVTTRPIREADSATFRPHPNHALEHARVARNLD
jgi:hypothetical protein